MNTTGKYLTDLAYDINVLKKHAKPLDDRAHPGCCIAWQSDGTLWYFDAEDGYPGAYYVKGHQNRDIANIENFTSIERLVAFMDKHSIGGRENLIADPVWIAFSGTEVQELNALLGDIEINL
jgi:hypothetical protein